MSFTELSASDPSDRTGPSRKAGPLSGASLEDWSSSSSGLGQFSVASTDSEREAAIDELDRCQTHESFDDPLASLHSLPFGNPGGQSHLPQLSLAEKAPAKRTMEREEARTVAVRPLEAAGLWERGTVGAEGEAAFAEWGRQGVDQKAETSEILLDSEGDDQDLGPITTDEFTKTNLLRSMSPPPSEPATAEEEAVDRSGGQFEEERSDLKEKTVSDDHTDRITERRQKPAKGEVDRRRFYDPGETQATKLRNQRTRQRLALEHERARIEAEDERERRERRRDAARRIEPELRRLAAVSEERQRKAGRGSQTDEKTVGHLRKIMRKVERTEVMLYRNDRAIILTEAQNRKRKEEQEMARQADLRRSQRRRCA
jgi:hypothetical protein